MSRRRLRWKLTASYVFVTTSALLVVELIFVIVLFVFVNPLRDTRIPKPEYHLITLVLASLIRPDLEPAATGQAADRLRWLVGDSNSSGLLLLVVDTSQRQRLLLPPDANSPKFPAMSGLLDAALAGQADSTRMYVPLADNRLAHVVPIMADDGRVLGALLVVVTPSIFAPRLLLVTAVIIGISLLIFTTAAALVGLIFGLFTGRGITHRLDRLFLAATAWGDGNFSIRAKDDTDDELGLLTDRLNQMAEQLQNLIQANQELATLEERNRLARELHDSIKQQMFALSMQLATANTATEKLPNTVTDALNEASTLVQNVQNELSAIIHALRPPALMGKGLASALRDYAEQWSQQQHIPVEFHLMDDSLPLPFEQVLFRVAQEALTNVARHSHATQVVLTLSSGGILIIYDNGSGFDTRTITRGIGLQSMRERVSAVGGTLIIISQPGSGTAIEVRLALPIDKEPTA